MTNDSPMPSNSNPKSTKIKQLGNLGSQAQKLLSNSWQTQIMPRSQDFSHYLLEKYRKIDLQNEPRQRRFVVATIILFIIWLLLVGTLNFSEIFVGFLVVVFTVWLSSSHLSFLDDIKFNWATPLFMLSYLGVFLLALLHANIDMARRVLSPSLPINPALVEVKTQLKSSLGKLILANSITLTPGTLTVDVVGEHLLVHWVDSSPGKDLEHATHAIAESFERHLRKMLL
jgi:multicomponent Na+:H+ antiporter subunit E